MFKSRKTIALSLSLLSIMSLSSKALAQTNQGSILRPGEYLLPGQSIISPNNLHTFIYQEDGNLVLYETDIYGRRRPTWDSGTYGTTSNIAILQPDGKLEIYDTTWRRVFSSVFSCNGSYLSVQNDGNVVIYKRDSNNAIWDTDGYTYWYRANC